MSRRWQKVWVFVALLFVLLVGNEILNTSRTDAVIGEVHHQRERQIEVGMKPFTGWRGRLTANKYLIAVDKITKRVLETVDLNIIFFAGHPNERVGIVEHERVAWLLFPIFIWGVLTLFCSNKILFKQLVVLTLVASVAWAVRFEMIDNEALTLVIFWVYGMIGVGIYDLARKFNK